MKSQTKQAIEAFRRVLQNIPSDVQRVIVTVKLNVRPVKGWMGLSATSDDAAIKAAITTADDQEILRLAKTTIAEIITGTNPRLLHQNTDHASLLARMATHLTQTPPETLVTSIRVRLEAYHQACEQQRRSEEEAAVRRRKQRDAQERLYQEWLQVQAERATREAEQKAIRAAQRAEAVTACKAGTLITTEGGHTIIYVEADQRHYRCTQCTATWTRMPKWDSPCAGEPPPASPQEMHARRVRDALLTLPDPALQAVAEHALERAQLDGIETFRAVLPTLTVDDWWNDVIPALITWLRAEPFGVSLHDYSPQAGLAAVESLLKVLQRLADLHRGRSVPITTTTAANYLGVTVDKIRDWIADGTLPLLETVEGDYGRGSVKYLLDCRDVIAARTDLASEINRFHQRRQRGIKAAATAIRNVSTEHEATLAKITELGDTLAPIFRAAYYCWHLNHFAKARTRVARSICYAMKDRVLEAIVMMADLATGHEDIDGWTFPLGSGNSQAHVSLAWHPTTEYTYLSIVIVGPGFRFPFHARDDNARKWLPPDLQQKIPHHPLSGDRTFTFGGRPASWIEEKVIQYVHVADVLCTWWCHITGKTPAEFTARLPSQLSLRTRVASYPMRYGWDDDAEDVWEHETDW